MRIEHCPFTINFYDSSRLGELFKINSKLDSWCDHPGIFIVYRGSQTLSSGQQFLLLLMCGFYKHLLDIWRVLSVSPHASLRHRALGLCIPSTLQYIAHRLQLAAPESHLFIFFDVN